MDTAPETVMQYIRGTRADPPQLAREEERRAIYGAALEQFEQLRTAAIAIGPAARPLPLFYALSQAGRAIVAARGTVPVVAGHGLGEDFGSAPAEVLRRAVKRAPRDHRSKSAPAEDAFGAVSRAIGSPDFTGKIDIGAAWAALPIATPLPDSSWRDAWRPSVMVSDLPVQGQRGLVGFDRETSAVALVSLVGHPRLKLDEALAEDRYPQIGGGVTVHLMGPGINARRQSWAGIVHAPDAGQLLKATPTASLYDEIKALIPTMEGHTEPMRPLMLWWIVLFGLSIFARYHPDLWASALKIDESDAAMPLEVVLQQAIDQLPVLVYQELYPAPVAS